MENKNDEIINKEEMAAMVEQDDNVIVYEIRGLIKSDGLSYYTRHELRDNPPELIITDKHNNEVVFKLTEELTKEMHRGLGLVNKVYHGYRKHTPEELREMEFSERIKYEFENRTVRFVITILSLLIIVGLIILKVIGG